MTLCWLTEAPGSVSQARQAERAQAISDSTFSLLQFLYYLILCFILSVLSCPFLCVSRVSIATPPSSIDITLAVQTSHCGLFR